MMHTHSGADVFGITSRGGREENEDAFIVLELAGAHLLAVADGLGGCPAGEVASRIAVETVGEEVRRNYSPETGDGSLPGLLKGAFIAADEAIRAEAVGERAGMATTLVAALVRGDLAVIAHTGDSRAYVLDGGIRFRTRDHSPVQRMVDSGVLDERRARHHPLSNIVEHALGIDMKVDLETVRIGKGETLLLSTDGLHDYVEEEVFVRCVRRRGAEEAARCMMGEALKNARDNITLVVYRPAA